MHLQNPCNQCNPRLKNKNYTVLILCLSMPDFICSAYTKKPNFFWGSADEAKEHHSPLGTRMLLAENAKVEQISVVSVSLWRNQNRVNPCQSVSKKSSVNLCHLWLILYFITPFSLPALRSRFGEEGWPFFF